ncbi:endolysin [Bacillus phage PBC2]|uniref:N-acetylmuramoyl-L-alanine amidase n=1 Tax=Bacillus phage PBC2 TaxID=1675029 RepID=A0A218KC88_9CAUD|nr:endolysin [Bacillus phage PBC2]AKQ08512.1 putative alanine amidase [Bacillus phage PBC2]
MAISVRQKLVDSSKYSLKCPYSMTAEYITIHNTYNDASANNEVQYMITNSNATSFHYAVDDFEVVQGIPNNRNAWHCGDGNGNGNRKSIGVEICYSMSGGDRYRKAEALAIKFVAQLLRERGWGIDRVKKHQDWSGKYCPHRILDEGRWQAVKNAIQAELNGGGSTGGGTTQPPIDNSTGVVRVTADVLNLRNQPSTSGAIVGKIYQGEEYKFWAISNGWYNLGGDQWASGTYLQVISGGTPQPPKPVTGIAYITGYNVNLRSGAGTGFSVIRQLNAPESYKVWGEKDGWLNLGGDQWVKNDSSFVRFVRD